MNKEIEWDEGEVVDMHIEPGSAQEEIFGMTGKIKYQNPPKGFTLHGRHYIFAGRSLGTMGGAEDGKTLHMAHRDDGDEFLWVDEQTGEEFGVDDFQPLP